MNNPRFNNPFINSYWFDRFELNKVTQGHAQLLRWNALGQSRGNRSENITAMKRSADRLAKEFIVGEMKSAVSLLSLAHPTENAIVGTNEKLIGATDQDRAARRTYAGIDYGNMNRARGKRLIRSQEIKRGRANILGRNFVTDIDDTGAGVNGKDYAFHCAHKIILRAEVG